VYTVPNSVHCEIDTIRGCTACSKPTRSILLSTSSGVSLPCSVATVSSFTPAIDSGAPHSSTFRCALSAQITASHRRQAARSDRTLAAVPLKTKYVRASLPNCSATCCSAARVRSSWP